jgi:hypothetical protein
MTKIEMLAVAVCPLVGSNTWKLMSYGGGGFSSVPGNVKDIDAPLPMTVGVGKNWELVTDHVMSLAGIAPQAPLILPANDTGTGFEVLLVKNICPLDGAVIDAPSAGHGVAVGGTGVAVAVGTTTTRVGVGTATAVGLLFGVWVAAGTGVAVEAGDPLAVREDCCTDMARVLWLVDVPEVVTRT